MFASEALIKYQPPLQVLTKITPFGPKHFHPSLWHTRNQRTLPVGGLEMNELKFFQTCPPQTSSVSLSNSKIIGLAILYVK